MSCPVVLVKRLQNQIILKKLRVTTYMYLIRNSKLYPKKVPLVRWYLNVHVQPRHIIRKRYGKLKRLPIFAHSSLFQLK